ncbi:hypothetical protein ANCCEY_07840 [Ancylostoma ceylanicum]|uniref:Uncharacterized protein n=1 Tax=Ancylostoma ceylanicum TaxID=53326 RepID=A0A0D6LSQ1_9BILA|nr:hypothetical protein ANCCEY_07840 [Ancylostoma ceylanicum]
MNKKDLFMEKIKRVSIKTAFPEYTGPQTYEDSIKYIKQRFEMLNQNPKKTIFVHETCATDTDQVQKILDSKMSPRTVSGDWCLDDKDVTGPSTVLRQAYWAP